jgi:S1-C subfamily serine protease
MLVLAACSSASEPSRPRAERLLPRAAVRVRVDTCEGPAVASGFLVRGRTVVTNRHVVEDALDAAIEVRDGRTVEANSMRDVASTDLGVIHLRGPASPVLRLAARDAISGDRVYGAGYPRGGPLRTTTGRVIDYVSGAEFGVRGKVMRTSTETNLGSSGGPVLNRRGAVVGIVFAVERTTDYTLAIPVSVVRRELRGSVPVSPPCAP